MVNGRWHVKIGTSPVHDPLLMQLVKKMEECSLNSGRTCQVCPKFKYCDEWYSIVCGYLRDDMMKPVMLDKYLAEFALVSKAGG